MCNIAEQNWSKKKSTRIQANTPSPTTAQRIFTYSLSSKKTPAQLTAVRTWKRTERRRKSALLFLFFLQLSSVHIFFYVWVKVHKLFYNNIIIAIYYCLWDIKSKGKKIIQKWQAPAKQQTKLTCNWRH